MPKVDFNKVDDVQDFSPLAEGKYKVRVAEVEESSTQYGDEMWKLRFAVAEGPCKGRYIFDNLVFSEAALKRAKLICARLGLDVKGEVDLTPSMLKGKTCVLTVEIEEYEDHEGKPKKRNVVPFAGYEKADSPTTVAAGSAGGDSESGEDDDESGMPF